MNTSSKIYKEVAEALLSSGGSVEEAINRLEREIKTHSRYSYLSTDKQAKESDEEIIRIKTLAIIHLKTLPGSPRTNTPGKPDISRNSIANSPSTWYENSKSDNDSLLDPTNILSPLNPISPFSIWDNGSDSSGSNDSNSSDDSSSSSYDNSSSSETNDW